MACVSVCVCVCCTVTPPSRDLCAVRLVCGDGCNVLVEMVTLLCSRFYADKQTTARGMEERKMRVHQELVCGSVAVHWQNH